MPTQTGSIDFKSTKGFQSYASGQYTTKTEFDNLEIGGRNLLYNTADWSSWACTAKATVSNGVLTSTNTDTSAYQRANGWFTLSKADLVGRVITISFEAKKTDATALDALCLQLFTTSAAPKSVQSGNIAEGTRCYLRLNQASTDKIAIKNASSINVSTWTKVSVTCKPSEVLNTSGYTDYAYLALYIGIINKAGSAQYRNIKAEFGDRATDWSPAPEDATERIVKAETAIEQTANNVLIKATQSDTTAAQGGQHLIESLINVAPSGVKIAASKVEIDGTAVFNAANAIPDTRSNNQPPSWYFTNYPKQSVTEFKTSSVMGLTGETYCYVTTVTGWADSSGGYPKQTAQIGSKTYWRVGVSASAWSAWQETESTAGSQAKVDALEIGGRNLLTWTGDATGHFLGNGADTNAATNTDRSWSVNSGGNGVGSIADVTDSPVQGVNKSFRITGNTSGNRDFQQHVPDLVALGTDGKWTFSAYVRAIGSSCTALVRIWSSVQQFQKSWTAETNWTFVKFTVTIGGYTDSDPAKFLIGMTGAGSIEYIAPKLERGDRATDWSPAPEDVAALAVKRTQRIWYRKSAAGAPATPGTASSNWVVKADDGSNAWTKMHISITEAEKIIYTCEQYEMGDGTVGYTSVLLDNTITVIDGGKIITGSVTANQIAAGTITGEQIAADTIEGGNIKGNAITAEHLSAAFSLDLGKVDGLKERLESIEGGVSRLQDNTQWVHYDQVAGTVFGESGSANNVTVKGGGIDFNTDEGRAAWATGGVFHANEMEAGTIDTQTITMGDWAIVQSGSSFYIDYIGS